MLRSLLLLTLTAVTLLLNGCASSGSGQDDVSSIPWNRPERWEGQGPMGGMMNTR